MLFIVFRLVVILSGVQGSEGFLPMPPSGLELFCYFLSLSNLLLYILITTFLSICLFYPLYRLAIVNKAARNREVNIFFKLLFWVSSDIYPEVESLSHKEVPFSIF